MSECPIIGMPLVSVNPICVQARKKKKKESIYFLGSIWAKIHHADSEVGPMSFVIKLNMSCKSFKLHLQRESHIIRFFITEIAIQYVLVWLAKAVI